MSATQSFAFILILFILLVITTQTFKAYPTSTQNNGGDNNINGDDDSIGAVATQGFQVNNLSGYQFDLQYAIGDMGDPTPGPYMLPYDKSLDKERTRNHFEVSVYSYTSSSGVALYRAFAPATQIFVGYFTFRLYVYRENVNRDIIDIRAVTASGNPLTGFRWAKSGKTTLNIIS